MIIELFEFFFAIFIKVLEVFFSLILKIRVFLLLQKEVFYTYNYIYTYSCYGSYSYISYLLELASQRKGNCNSVSHDTSHDIAHKLNLQYLIFIAYAFPLISSNGTCKAQLISSSTNVISLDSNLQKQKFYMPGISNIVTPVYKNYPQINTFFMLIE